MKQNELKFTGSVVFSSIRGGSPYPVRKAFFGPWAWRATPQGFCHY